MKEKMKKEHAFAPSADGKEVETSRLKMALLLWSNSQTIFWPHVPVWKTCWYSLVWLNLVKQS